MLNLINAIFSLGGSGCPAAGRVSNGVGTQIWSPRICGIFFPASTSQAPPSSTLIPAGLLATPSIGVPLVYSHHNLVGSGISTSPYISNPLIIGGSNRSLLGINIDDIAYFSPMKPFNNYVKGASKVFTTLNTFDDVTVPVDVSGYPTSLPSGIGATIILQFTSGEAPGTYLIGWNGPAVVTVGGGTSAGSNTIAWSRTNPSILDSMLVSWTSPITNLTITKSGVADTGLWRREFLDNAARFNTIRMLGLHKTNEDRDESLIFPDERWHNYQLSPLSVMVDLCNKAGANMWLPLHHKASDSLVRQVAQYIKNNLSGVCYIEHSNEVWNPGFPQHAYAHTLGQLAGGTAGGNHFTYHLTRTARIGEIFKEEGVNHVCMLGWQSVGHFAFNFYRSELPSGILPPSIDAVAIAPYFGGQVGQSGYGSDIPTLKASGIPGVLAEARNALIGVSGDLNSWMTYLSGTGKALYTYEAGQHLAAEYSTHGDQAWVDLLANANRDPGMYDLYRDYLRLWDRKTNHAEMCLLSLCSMYNQFGSWGMTEYEGQSLSTAHKMRAAVDWISGVI